MTTLTEALNYGNDLIRFDLGAFELAGTEPKNRSDRIWSDPWEIEIGGAGRSVRRGGSEWLRVARAGWARVRRERKRGWGWVGVAGGGGGSEWLGWGWVGVPGLGVGRDGWPWLAVARDSEKRAESREWEEREQMAWNGSRAHSRVLENGLRKNFP